jgi:hypothetical protein
MLTNFMGLVNGLAQIEKDREIGYMRFPFVKRWFLL